MGEPLIELVEVTKSFGSTRALDRVSFEVRAGEVHVVAGENGAGKSTLIKILCGVIQDFEGRRVVRAPISAIHQELSLVGPMSAADNLGLSQRRKFFGLRRPRTERERAASMLRAAGLDVDPRAPVERLAIGVRQQLEIARALGERARVIVMDEPTSALGEAEAERLIERVRQLSAEGAGIVYISHRMEEIFRVADRITVLRDGTTVLSAPARELDREKLIGAMLGRSMAAAQRGSIAGRGDAVLEVRELSVSDPGRPDRHLLDRVDLRVSPGEILGVFGTLGSGASVLLHAMFGALGRPERGRMLLAGKPYAPASPRHAIEKGVVLLASDRQQSLVGELGIADNVTLSSLARWSPHGFIDRDAELGAARRLLEELSVRGARELGNPVSQLSGGNQQKVALARCLLAEPRVLLLDEPTRGIDVGAKADVHARILGLAERGMAVVLVTSELEELLDLSQRVIVIHRGHVVDELERGELTRERILASAMGGGAEARA